MKKGQLNFLEEQCLQRDQSVVRLIKQAPDVKQAIIYIEQIDFSTLIQDLITKQRWTSEQAFEVCRQYRNFLFLLVKYPEKVLFPSAWIDKFWRQHIINTQQYAKDCEAIFGHYLHYYPYTECAHLEAFIAETGRLYWQEFGEPLPGRE